MARRTIPVGLLVLAAVLLAGCTGPDEPAAPVLVQQTGNPPVTPAGMAPKIMAPLTVTTIPVIPTESPVKIFRGDYHWAEYRINNTITLPPNPRYQWEYRARIQRSAETWKGILATHELVTVTGDHSYWKDGMRIVIKDGYHATEDRYYERSTKRLLGGTFRASGEGVDDPGQILPGDDVYREDRNWGWLLISPFEEMNSPLVFRGVESVTVPAGTFDARNYSGNFHNLSGFPLSCWVSDGIPVPVQYRIANPGLGGEDPVQTFELAGWG